MEDVISSSAYKKAKNYVPNLKGKVSGNLLVIEDIFDYNKTPRNRRHSCLCKCMICGKYFNILAYDLVRGTYTKVCKCERERKDKDFQQEKFRIMNLIQQEYNRQKVEAITNSDYERLENLKEIEEFVKNSA